MTQQEGKRPGGTDGVPPGTFVRRARMTSLHAGCGGRSPLRAGTDERVRMRGKGALFSGEVGETGQSGPGIAERAGRAPGARQDKRLGRADRAWLRHRFRPGHGKEGSPLRFVHAWSRERTGRRNAPSGRMLRGIAERAGACSWRAAGEFTARALHCPGRCAMMKKTQRAGDAPEGWRAT